MQRSPSNHNVTLRHNTKSKKVSSTDTILNPNEQISHEALRDIIRQELETVLKSTIKELVTEHLVVINGKINCFEESLSFNNNILEQMKNKLEDKVFIIEKLEKENIELHSTVKELSSRLNSIEQHMRECNVEINGIPEHRNENLPNIMQQLSKIVECPITNTDIQYVTRVAKLNKDSKRPRAVVLKLCSRETRDNILAAVTKFNKAHKDDKLSSKHLGIGNKREAVFVSEHLSPQNKHLHAATRQKAKEAEYKFVWVRDGRIFAKKKETSQAIHVRSIESLSLLK